MTEPTEPPKPRRGRKPGATGKARTGYIEGRVSDAQEETWVAAGGIKWLRALLDQYAPDALKALLKSKP